MFYQKMILLLMYQISQLTNVEHNLELVKENITYLTIDYKQSGIGTKSCAPELDEQYRFN